MKTRQRCEEAFGRNGGWVLSHTHTHTGTRETLAQQLSQRKPGHHWCWVMLTTSAGTQDGKKKTIGWGWRHFRTCTLGWFHLLIVKIHHSTIKSCFFCGKLCTVITKWFNQSWLEWKNTFSSKEAAVRTSKGIFYSVLQTNSALCFFKPFLEGACLRRPCFDCNLRFWLYCSPKSFILLRRV